MQTIDVTDHTPPPKLDRLAELKALVANSGIKSTLKSGAEVVRRVPAADVPAEPAANSAADVATDDDVSADVATPPRPVVKIQPVVPPVVHVTDPTERFVGGMQLWLQDDDGGSDDDQLPIRTGGPILGDRIAWSLKLKGGQFSVIPVLQKPDGKGGWSKGRRLAIGKLKLDTATPMDDYDRKVATAIHRDTEIFVSDTPQFVIEKFAALAHLVGCPKVDVDGQPVTVGPASIRVGMSVTREGLKFHPIGFDGMQVDAKVEFEPEWNESKDGLTSMIWFDPTANHISTGRVEDWLVGMYEDLMAAPPLPAADIEKVTRAVRPFQRHLTLLLPLTTDGPIVPQSSSLVVLLRSGDADTGNAQTRGTAAPGDGRLDYGIRVCDGCNRLALPGGGPLLTSTQRDGQPVQLQRSAADERSRAERLVQILDLAVDDHNGWFSSTANFAASLRLVEQLQSLVCHSPEFIGPVEMMWDKSSDQPLRVLGTVKRENVRVEVTKKRNWFGIGGDVKLVEETLPLLDLLSQLPAANDGQLSGEFVHLSGGAWARIENGLRQQLTDLRNAVDVSRDGMRIDASAVWQLRDLADAGVQIDAGEVWQQCLDRLRTAETLDPTVPAGLRAELRDYQIEGFRWLSRLAQLGIGCILADDMGLGKTLQTLAVLLARCSAGPALVIAPTSVGFNWVREAQRFAPELNVHSYRDTGRAEFLPSVAAGDVVVCSYALAMRDADALAGVHFNTLVLDEAQAIKNSRGKTSVAIAGIDADWKVALTGTPVENHLGELWSLLSVVSPGVLGSWSQFEQRFGIPIQRDNDNAVRAALAKRLRPFVLRRTKSDVLKELPPRTEMNLYVDLSPAERKRYDEFRREAIAEIRESAQDKMSAMGDGQKSDNNSRFQILAALTRLRQLACHVGLVDESWTESSAKLDCLCETMQSLRDEGHRALVFSQFTSHLRLIRAALDARGISYQYLDGSTPAAGRQAAVDRFQNGNSTAFLISLKAGGTGLNLTAADYVIHMDPWWNPAVEDQATDRAHRMGQRKPVMVYRIIARKTIEETILSVHAEKRDLAAGVIEGTSAAAKLSQQDLIAMLMSGDEINDGQM